MNETPATTAPASLEVEPDIIGAVAIFYNSIAEVGGKSLAALIKSSGVSISTPMYWVTTIFKVTPFSR